MLRPLLCSFLLAAPALAAPTAGSQQPANAYAIWTSPFEGSENLHEVNKFVLDLQPGAPLHAAALARAAGLVPMLDGAVAKLREGLAAKECTWDLDRRTPDLTTLAHAARVRAVLGASRKERVEGIVRDLLAAGRRIARCDRSPLAGFVVGAAVERGGRDLAIWGGSVGLWDAGALKTLVPAVSEGALSTADLERAVTNDLEVAKRQQEPLAGSGGGPYDHAATIELFRTLLNRLGAEVRKTPPDFLAFRSSFSDLLDASERKLLEAGPDADQAVLMEGVNALFQSPRENALGRHMVFRAMHEMTTQVDRLVRELDAGAVRAKEFSKVRPQAQPEMRIDRTGQISL